MIRAKPTDTQTDSFWPVILLARPAFMCSVQYGNSVVFYSRCMTEMVCPHSALKWWCVSGVFLFCWTPFFTVNIINAVCLRYDLLVTSSLSATGSGSDVDKTSWVWSGVCDVDPWLFSFLVWLGYINSFLNPVIYTIFNTEFRRAFRRILYRRLPIFCGRERRPSGAMHTGPSTAARWWRSTTHM